MRGFLRMSGNKSRTFGFRRARDDLARRKLLASVLFQKFLVDHLGL
jgi:hypothetical protein